MTFINSAHTIVEGTVEARNDKGLRIDGNWLNLSKFRPIDLPDAGARVRADVDPRGYLCSVEVLEPASELRTSATELRTQTITRLSVLKTAAQFVGQMAQMHDDARSDHVIPLAEKWLAWVLQDG